MGTQEILNILWAWTPFLGRGFVNNILISVVAMLLGTIIGWGFAVVRASSSKVMQTCGGLATSVFRNIPSFVLLFYIAFLVPVEFVWQEKVIKFPLWIKGTIALTIPVIGFASDQLLNVIHQLRAKKHQVFLLFAASWTQYFVIIIMASSTASVIGIGEIVSRANTVIAAINDPRIMLWLYCYVALWFLALGAFVSVICRWVVVIRLRPSKISTQEPEEQKG